MLLLFVSFVGGVLTVLAPCILPLLPVVVGGSLTDGRINKKKALTIIISLGVAVILFTFLLKVSTVFIHIPAYTWTVVSGGIVLVLGIVTLFPSLWENKILARLNRKSNILLGKGNQKKSFWGDVIVGAALGPVFTTCSPTYFIVLATVLPVNPALGLVYLLSYSIGLCIALLIVVSIGQKIMHKLDVAADPKGTFKRVLGVIFILVGIAILTGYDKKAETWITNAGFFDATKIEQKLLDNKTDSSSLTGKALQYKKAPEISSPDGFINTDGKPITLASLRGKVVLLDIWTYSCINCQRTIPYINEWYAKYKDKGFVVVGLHTPEFAFEKVQSNVEKAVKDLGIKYPVVMDNDYSTWRALGNEYWPRKYLIDKDGYIIYDHIGEGGYDQTEAAIVKALGMSATSSVSSASSTGGSSNVSDSMPVGAISVDADKVKSPETYFGFARNEYLANGQGGVAGEQTLTVPADGEVIPNALYLGGTWNFEDEYAESESSASVAKPVEVVFGYEAKNVYMAAGSDQGADLEIYRDGVLVKKMTIKDEQLYTLISGADYGKHTLRIKILKGKLKAFTFTFG